MKSLLRCAATLTLAIAMIACETTVMTPRSDAQAELNAHFGSAGGGRAAGGVTSANSTRPAAQPAMSAMTNSDWADPCAANLDEITGALLVYYSTHKYLPPTLDQIPKVSPTGEKISLTCPVSGKRYVYHPEGLNPPLFTDENGKSHVGSILILYDAEVSHEMVQHLTNGTDDFDVKKAVYLGIVMEPREEGVDQPIQMSVERIEPGILATYLRFNAPSTAAVPAVQPISPPPQ
jgi:hypothetical protein